MKMSKSFITRLVLLILVGVALIVIGCTACSDHVDANHNGKCDKCQTPDLPIVHDWSNNDSVCVVCGFSCPHHQKVDNCICNQCGIVLHKWKTDNSGECLDCSIVCKHPNLSDNCICSTCASVIHDWIESNPPTCKNCGVVCRHDNKNRCVCVDCGETVHNWDEGYCTTCGYDCPHYTLNKNCICQYCKAESHLFKYDFSISNSKCINCGILHSNSPVAQIVLTKESEMAEEDRKWQSTHPTYTAYFHPIKRVSCYFMLKENSYITPSQLILQHHLRTLLPQADISTLDSLGWVYLGFERNEFTQEVHDMLMQIQNKESQIEKLSISGERRFYRTYIPRLELYTNYPTEVDFEDAPVDIWYVDDQSSYLIKSKQDLDNYITLLKQNRNPREEYLQLLTNTYNDEFFSKNALIVSKEVSRHSISVRITVEGVYAKQNKLYTLIRTDEPSAGLGAILSKNYTLVVSQESVQDIDEVLVLD